jgi:hypothetical protein
MTLAITTAAGVLSLAGGFALARRHRGKRNRVYAALAQQQSTSSASIRIAFGANETRGAAHSLAPTFAGERLKRADSFLAPTTLARLREDALSNVAHMERSFIPFHKQGSTLSYEQILRRAPHLVAFYYDAEVQKWISAVTRTQVRPTPLRDQSSLSVRDLRVVLSMTYCDDPRISWVAELARRVTDTAYYGIRALWD